MVLELSINDARLSAVKEWRCLMVVVLVVVADICGGVVKRALAEDMVSHFHLLITGFSNSFGAIGILNYRYRPEVLTMYAWTDL